MSLRENEIVQGGGRVYIDSGAGVMVQIGILSENGIDCNFSHNIEGVGSATSGEGKVAHFTSGMTGTVKLTMRTFDKHMIGLTFLGLTPTTTVITNGYTGNIKGGADAGRRLLPRRLVVYSTGSDASGVGFLQDNTNTLALEVFKAVTVSDLSWVFDPSTPAEIEMEFECQYDETKTNGNKVFALGAGVSITV